MDAVESLVRLQLLHAMRTGILFQAEDVPGHLFSDTRIKLTNRPFSSGSDFDSVGQDLLSQFPYEFPE